MKEKNSMKINNVYIQISVEDLVRAKKFYEDIFNFEVSWFLNPETGWCEFNLPGKGVRLGLNTRENDKNKKPSWGILTLDVTNLEEAHEYMIKKGLNPTDIADVPDMISFFNIKDSEDNTIQIVGEPRVKSEK